MIGFSGYSEGWALYAEQLAVEMGMYEGNPEGQIGMLHDAMFRAVRLVVDSGMHHKTWSREQAVKYMVDNIGDQEASAITEIERYVVWPGQACSYMVGKIEFLRLRDKARKALGRRFDIRKFHDAMFRAVRLVVDSGMHHKRWSREQAVKYMVDNVGDQEASAITEIERYVVWPGQACSYMVGKIEFLRLRDKAKKALGRRFDIRRFHDVCLLSGGVPLAVLEHVVDGYIAAAK